MFVDRHKPPYKAAGAVFLVLVAVATSFVYFQLRGELAPKTQLTLMSSRAGLVVDPGSKVTYNGVEIGKVAAVNHVNVDGSAKAKLTLNVEPRYITFHSGQCHRLHQGDDGVRQQVHLLQLIERPNSATDFEPGRD